MLKYVNHDIVFQEFPDEVTLAINLSLCPNGCPGCHSAFLQGDVGEELTEERLLGMVGDYRDEVTCVGFMGGDNDPSRVAQLARLMKKTFDGEIKTGWYSGRQDPPKGFDSSAFDYAKFGPYIAALGPLKSPSTNQRLYKYKADGTREDITQRFWKK